jgi:hypothetical protein
LADGLQLTGDKSLKFPVPFLLLWLQEKDNYLKGSIFLDFTLDALFPFFQGGAAGQKNRTFEKDVEGLTGLFEHAEQ